MSNVALHRQFLAMAIFVASVFSTPVSAQKKATLNFVMPTPPATYLLPYFIANDLGWFKALGVEVAEQVVSGDPNALRAVLAGNADITFVGPPTIFDAVISDAKIKMFCSWQPITDYQLVIGTGKGRSLADLAGKRVAVTGPSSMTAYIPQMLMKKSGIDTSTIKFVPVGGMSARLQAVAADRVDATLVDTFFATKAEREGNAHVAASVASEFPGLGYVFAVAKEGLLADPVRRPALDAFVVGSIKGARFIVTNPDGAAEILKKRLPDEDITIIRSTIDRLNAFGVWGLNGGLDRKVIEFSAKTFTELGLVKRSVNYEEVVDPAFVDRAISQLGRM